MLTIDNIILELFKSFPEFEKKLAYEKDDLLPYNVMGDFVLNFQERFLSDEISILDMERFFSFVNSMANSKDREVQNIFVVEVLELLMDNPETIKIARERLNDNGMRLLDKTLNGWK